jgi:hypothetical protein
MKKINLMIAFCLAISAVNAQQKKSTFVFANGVNLEPQVKNKELSLQFLLHSSAVWKDRVKLTLFGGYTISKEIKAPIFVAELGYEFENNFEHYLKCEKIILKEESIDYYAVGLAYNVKIDKKFVIIPFVEYGKESHEPIWAFGVNCYYKLF